MSSSAALCARHPAHSPPYAGKPRKRHRAASHDDDSPSRGEEPRRRDPADPAQRDRLRHDYAHGGRPSARDDRDSGRSSGYRAPRDDERGRNGHHRPDPSTSSLSTHTAERPIRPPPPRFRAERGGGDDLEGARVLGGGRRNNAPGSSFDRAAALPAPVRAGSATRAASATPSSARRPVAFAAPPSSTSTPAAAAATPVTTATLESTTWSRGDARAKKAREPSPDLATIDAQNAAEFDTRLAAEIASEGLGLDRDWYLREEEGVADDTGEHAGFGEEETYARAKAGDKEPVVRVFLAPFAVRIFQRWARGRA